jgi:hypothetical protein
MAAYHEATNGKPRELGAARTVPGTIDALIVSYYQSPAFTTLRPTTARVYRNIIEKFRAAHGHKSVAGM